MRFFGISVILVLIGFAGFLKTTGGAPAPTAGPVFRTSLIAKGTLVSTVSASGTLNAVTNVLVGSQVSGRISELHADFNSKVKAGQIIARISPESFEARREQAKAELRVAQANVKTRLASIKRAEAELTDSRDQVIALKAQVEEARVARNEARRDLRRIRALIDRNVASQSALSDVATLAAQTQARLKTALARVEAHHSTRAAVATRIEIAKAELNTSKAQVLHRRAALKQFEIDYGHTFIRSPIDGVVVSRNVDVGQTVAASLQAPTLFTIAQDLAKMQVEVDVDEADIGRVAADQAATFTVDAFPNRQFKANVQQVRIRPNKVQNVVTYTVVLSLANLNGLLLPGMTANVDIVTAEQNDILRIPNAALRFKPKGKSASAKNSGGGQRRGRGERIIKSLTKSLTLSGQQVTDLRAIFDEAGTKVRAVYMSGAARDQIAAAFKKAREEIGANIPTILNGEQLEKYKKILARRNANPVRKETVWVLKDGKPNARTVFTGISDGQFTQLVRGQLKENERIIVGVSRPKLKPKGLFGIRW